MKGLTRDQLKPAEHHHPADTPIAHILVVDDDPLTRELLGINLRNAGYSVTCTEDAIAAGHSIVARMPDLVIADFKMPYMNGDDFIAALRGDATIPDLPVIFITSVENRPQIAGKTFGFPLLTKPLHADELIDTVAEQLRARRS